MDDDADNQRVLCRIANSAFAEVGRLLGADQRNAQSLRTTTANSRQVVREETITESLALRLVEEFPAHVQMKLFTPKEEARNGADWYWRIQKEFGTVHAHVQAKRVRRASFREPDEAGGVHIDQAQMQRLVACVKSEQGALPGLQAWLATFARVDALPPCECDPWRCLQHNCRGDCSGKRTIPSVWIAQAAKISNVDGVVPVREIMQNSVRLDCILPCIPQSGNEGPASKGFRLTPTLPSFSECVAAIENDPAIMQQFQGALFFSV
jgi:hypothetical protein